MWHGTSCESLAAFARVPTFFWPRSWAPHWWCFLEGEKENNAWWNKNLWKLVGWQVNGHKGGTGIKGGNCCQLWHNTKKLTHVWPKNRKNNKNSSAKKKLHVQKRLFSDFFRIIGEASAMIYGGKHTIYTRRVLFCFLIPWGGLRPTQKCSWGILLGRSVIIQQTGNRRNVEAWNLIIYQKNRC